MKTSATHILPKKKSILLNNIGPLPFFSYLSEKNWWALYKSKTIIFEDFSVFLTPLKVILVGVRHNINLQFSKCVLDVSGVPHWHGRLFNLWYQSYENEKTLHQKIVRHWKRKLEQFLWWYFQKRKPYKFKLDCETIIRFFIFLEPILLRLVCSRSRHSDSDDDDWC